MAYYHQSSGSDTNVPTYSKSFDDRWNGRRALYEDKLSRCFKVSVEGHSTSHARSDLRAIYSMYFGSCGNMFDVVVTSNPTSRVVESCCYIYFYEKVAQEKAVALNGTNVGFPLSRRYEGPAHIAATLGGWNVVVKALPKQSCEFSPTQVADALRVTSLRSYLVAVAGYDLSAPPDVISSALLRLFSPCGEILYPTLLRDPDQPCLLQTHAFVCVAGAEAYAKAIRLNGSDLGGRKLVVTTVEPKRTQIIPPNEDSILSDWPGPSGYRRKDTHPPTTSY